ncbi:MAG: site-specific integrase [Paludibacteraceae bacterium]|nr:site-specific integrase [Clostridiales bacterium]MBP5423648.1 site-specific integrase [Paludibacteraceae bacterium]
MRKQQITSNALNWHSVQDKRTITVLEQVEKYVATKNNVRYSTRTGYMTVINLLKSDQLGKERIDVIRISDAKLWLIKLQTQDSKGYSTIHAIRGVMKPAFQLAVDDDYISKNPFAFDLSSVIINDSVKRESLSRKDEKRFLDFVRTDPHYCRYYEGIYILFKTGLRISEFCGLTVKDVDFKKHSIRIDHQLNKKAGTGYYIQDPKTENGNRIIPMTPDVEECFRKVIENRNPPSKEPTVDGKKGFLFFDKDGHIVYSLHWEHYFKHILKKYNSTHRRKLPTITPHICRHTYCSNMAKSGINPKILQYLMGHSDISITLNTYTHVKYEDAVVEFRRLKITKRKQSYAKL